MKNKKLVIELDGSRINVTFDGEYINKKELDQVLRAIRRKHRETIRAYRKKRIIEEHKRQTRERNENERTKLTQTGTSNKNSSAKDAVEAGSEARAKSAVDGAAKATLTSNVARNTRANSAAVAGSKS